MIHQGIGVEFKWVTIHIHEPHRRQAVVLTQVGYGRTRYCAIDTVLPGLANLGIAIITDRGVLTLIGVVFFGELFSYQSDFRKGEGWVEILGIVHHNLRFPTIRVRLA